MVIENKDLEEAYGVLCEAPCPGAKMTLSNWTHWTFEVQRNNAYGKYEFYIRLDPYVKQKVVFQPNSTTANKSFLLPTEMNTLSEIKLLTRGKFQLGTDIKVKNMDTSEIYSCIYLLDQLSQVPYHECKSINDSMWRVELTSRSRLIRDRVVLTVLLVVHGSGIHSLHQLRLKKLAYIPTFAEFALIGNLRMNEVLVYFNYPHEAFDIFQIVITNALTGKVYGCGNIFKPAASKYSCKLLGRKIWQLIILSSEELEQAFFVEIIQGTLSSFSKGLVWQNLCEHGYGCVDHFYLETYEDNEITGLKLHFLDKPIRINAIRLKNDYAEYEFKIKEESKDKNERLIEFNPLRKVKSQPNVTQLILKIVVGLFSLFTVLLFIIVIIVSIRYQMLKNNSSQGHTSTPQGSRKGSQSHTSTPQDSRKGSQSNTPTPQASSKSNDSIPMQDDRLDDTSAPSIRLVPPRQTTEIYY
ncbi:Hypothetical predicted protein [Octopus vulgaris]|uniref:Uncharacterized protein n=1 Tax=Octopus vulgaris TaxID=6645 RepID=A0AA36B843_OCTVU|nr:Hypothetical predicted protein [Octopus vulgaris]